MKKPWMILTSILVLTLLAACGSNAPRPAILPSSPSLSPTDVPRTVAGPSSADEAEASPTSIPAVDEETDPAGRAGRPVILLPTCDR